MLRLQDIKFSDFQRFLVDGDLSIVGDEGERLYNEYRDATMTAETMMIIQLENRMKFHQMHIALTQILVDALSEVYSESLAEELRKLYPDCTIQYETIDRDLKVVVNLAKAHLVEFDAAKKDRDAIAGKSQGKPTYEYYESITNEISKMLGFHIPDDINTMRWCKYYVQLINQQDQPKYKDNGRG